MDTSEFERKFILPASFYDGIRREQTRFLTEPDVGVHHAHYRLDLPGFWHLENLGDYFGPGSGRKRFELIEKDFRPYDPIAPDRSKSFTVPVLQMHRLHHHSALDHKTKGMEAVLVSSRLPGAMHHFASMAQGVGLRQIFQTRMAVSRSSALSVAGFGRQT